MPLLLLTSYGIRLPSSPLHLFCTPFSSSYPGGWLCNFLASRCYAKLCFPMKMQDKRMQSSPDMWKWQRDITTRNTARTWLLSLSVFCLFTYSSSRYESCCFGAGCRLLHSLLHRKHDSTKLRVKYLHRVGDKDKTYCGSCMIPKACSITLLIFLLVERFCVIDGFYSPNTKKLLIKTQ